MDEQDTQDETMPPPAAPTATLLSRDSILDADDVRTEDVEVPEWGGVVRVRGLTGTERDKYEESLQKMKGKLSVPNWQNARAKLVQLVCVDDQGRRLFGETDVKTLGRKSAAALTRVYIVGSRLSGLDDEAVEKLLGNSESDPSDDSGSD